MPSMLFYIIIFFAALGVLSFLAKLVFILRAPARATMDDAGDFFALAGISGFTIGCALMLYGKAHLENIMPGAVVTAGGVVVALAGIALKSRVRLNEVKNPEDMAAALAKRQALANRLGIALGQRPETAATTVFIRPRKKVPWLVFVLFAMFGAVFGYQGASALVHGYNSTHWPHTDGVIESASVERHLASGRHSHGYVYAANISYDYKVTGMSYTGTRVRFGTVESSLENARAIVNKYPPGRQVAVFYSPSYPASAVLQPGIFGGVWMNLGLGGLFFAVGVIGLVVRRSQ